MVDLTDFQLRGIANTEGVDDPELFVDLVNTTLMSRMDLVRKMIDPRRDIDDECGFPKDIDLKHYHVMYEREPLAAKVVDIYPNHTWKVTPKVFEDEDTETETAFEIRWNEIQNLTRGEENHFKDNEGSEIWRKCKKVDRLSGIGKYGILVIGFDDGQDLEEEVTKKEGMDVNYISAYSQLAVDIEGLEQDEKNPRYMMPTWYKITTGFDTDEDVNIGGKAGDTFRVHYSRVIHVSEDTGEGDLFHTPRMQLPFNLLHGARKLYGAGPEGYWKMCFTSLLIEAHPGVSHDDIDHASVNTEIDKYQNGLQKVLKLVGLSGKAVAPSVVNPQPFIDTCIDAICIHLEIPKRIFLGSERGELASSQDQTSWAESVGDRQTMHVTPNILVPLINRLINMGVLPVPPDGFSIDWPDLTQPTKEQQTNVAKGVTEAISKFVQGGIGDSFMTKVDFLVEVIGMESEKAQTIINNFEDEFPNHEDDLLLGLEDEEDEGAEEDGKPPIPGLPVPKPGVKPKPGKKPPGTPAANKPVKGERPQNPTPAKSKGNSKGDSGNKSGLDK